LKKQLEQRNIIDLNQVVFAGLDSQGNFYLDTKADIQAEQADISDKPPD